MFFKVGAGELREQGTLIGVLQRSFYPELKVKKKVADNWCVILRACSSAFVLSDSTWKATKGLTHFLSFDELSFLAHERDF